MVRITEILLFLIIFDLLLSEVGRYDLFCLSIDEIFLASGRVGQITISYYQKQWYLGYNSDHKKFVQLLGGASFQNTENPSTAELH